MKLKVILTGVALILLALVAIAFTIVKATDFNQYRDYVSQRISGGIVAPKGPAGSLIMFHSCLVHASTSNLSPWDRINVYLSLCAVSNHIRRFQRPDYIAHRDFTPIECLPDDSLLAKEAA